MKKMFLFISSLSYVALGLQPAKVLTAADVLRQTSLVLNQPKAISYESYREINNFKENYFAKNNGKSYIEFDNSLPEKVSRFQLQNKGLLQIYNGSEYFALDSGTHTYDLEKKNLQRLSSLSLLYNSLATLRLSLPLILSDPGIPTSLQDTVIEGKSFHLLKFELHKKSISFPDGFNTFDAEVIRYYKLVIDKKSYLPYMILDGNSISKDQYYTRTVFTHITTDPVAPADQSWFYSSYRAYSPKPKLNRKKMLAGGSPLPDWKLPQYGSTDTISGSHYKGKIVLMEFWIKNCGYCMEAFPEMKKLQEKYGKQIEILSINAYDQKKEIDFFFKREKPAYKMLYNGEKFAAELGIYAYPATILLDQSGKIVYISPGFNPEKIEEAIAGLKTAG